MVVIASEGQALSIVREAIDEGIYSRFVFGDAAKRVSLVREIGGRDKLGGMYGTAGGSAPGNTATADWEAALIAEYGELPVLAYVKETYDATVALALAAQAAGSVDGAAIRDRLREIAGPPGRDTSQAPPFQGSPMACPCLLEGKRSTSMALPARWIGTKTATSVEVTSGHGASQSDLKASKNSTGYFRRTSRASKPTDVAQYPRG